jgi:hypothetical protein
MNEQQYIRELAKQVRDLAAEDVNKERIKRSRDLHKLKQVRPVVMMEELPWHEMNIDDELTLSCESEPARQMEWHFRSVLYRWKHIQVDSVTEDTFYINKAFSDTGIGIDVKEQIIASDKSNHIVSHQYEDQLDTEEKVDLVKIPVILAQPEIDEKRLEIAHDILDGIMPVKLRGHGIYYAPWDTIARFRSVENCFIDMALRPELVHKIMEKFTGVYSARFNQMEEQGLLDYNLPNLHCTPPYADGIPANDYDGGKVRFKDVWFRGMAQIFASASPEMQDEFDLQYMRPMMEKCAYSYYGCCEPLDRFIPYLKKVPNMKKIGVSPWANIRSSAEQIGSEYVYAFKPNPAFVAGDFDRDVVEKETVNTIEACIENKCPFEFVLKDVSTINYKPQNLINWAKTLSETIDRYFK